MTTTTKSVGQDKLSASEVYSRLGGALELVLASSKRLLSEEFKSNGANEVCGPRLVRRKVA